jgi:hypothetical protein
MQGDFSRNTFSKKNHYRGVLQQQGRVQLDADLNEQQAITQYYDETGARDLIGPAGVPKSEKNGNGFRIDIKDDNDLSIAQGNIYVDGILCENEKNDATYRNQGGNETEGDFPQAPMPEGHGIWLAYLDVWQRHITALDDPNIREKALGGPDTATRIKTVWQVKLAKVGEINATPDPGSFNNWTPFTVSTGKLMAKIDKPPASTYPCKFSPEAGFRRLENQLYRVEIHRGGPWQNATFKWSRDNGSVTALIEKIDNTIITLENINQDEVLGFSRNQWVEILSDKTELNSEPYVPHGTLVKITSANPSDRTIDIGSDNLNIDSNYNSKLRRWDYMGDYPEGIPVNLSWTYLEDGIWVKFSEGTFNPGDYWLIPARTLINSETGIIEWPLNGEEPAALEREGIYHHYCPLALVKFDGSKFIESPVDCRHKFPSLTDINAVDVGFNNNCEIPGAKTVQDAIDYLCKRDVGCTLIVVPGKGWQKVFDRIADGEDAKVCFQVGKYELDSPVILEKKGHIRISGCGEGTRIICTKSEIVFKFVSCKSVMVKDLYAEAEVTGFGSDANLKNQNGVLTFCACPKVTAESVILKCAAGAQRAASCIDVRDSVTYDRKAVRNPALIPVESVRIHNCDLSIGHQQSGILLVNVRRANIENNLIQTYEIPASLPLKVLLENRRYRSYIRSLMINSPKLGEPENDDVFLPGDIVGVGANKGYVWFKTDLLLSSVWDDWIQLSQPKGVQNNRDMLFHLINVTDRVLLNDGLLKAGSTTFYGFKRWYDELVRENIAVGSQGIVTGGTVAEEIRIINNKISGFMQGIHTGTSHRGVTSGTHNKAGIVHIMDNNIRILLSPVATQERHGIFVGNSESLIIQDNYVSVQRYSMTEQLVIDGIRVYGHTGRMMIVRQNHIVNANTGILFAPVSGENGSPQWVITDNVAPKSKQPVVVKERVPGTKGKISGLQSNYS